MSASTGENELTGIALFPLPNVVLFPRAILPLHIFEERYKAMMAEALHTRRQLAMALLRSGWEEDYHARPAIEPVVCVGTIITHQKLADGTYNLLLQGHTRAMLVSEQEGHAYRVATLKPLVETPAPDEDLRPYRDAFEALFRRPSLVGTGIGEQFNQLLAGPMLTAEIADLVAFNFIEDLRTRQSLLAEADVRRRVAATVAALQQTSAASIPASVPARYAPSLN